MKFSTRLCAALALSLSVALVATPVHAADPCPMGVIQIGVLKGYCVMQAYFPKLAANLVFTRTSTVSFLFANLVPHRMRYLLRGNTVDVSVEVENPNAGSAGPHEIVVLMKVFRGGVEVDRVPLQARANGVPGRGGSVQTYLGQITLANINADNDLLAMVSVDPPTTTNPNGDVLEWDETDNMLTRMCRVYGLVNPDVSQRSCT